MEEKLLESAKKLVKGENVIEVFNNLENILEEMGMYDDLIICKEIIWHLNGDDNKLREMAYLYREKSEDYNMGYLINMLYLFRTDKDLYNELTSNIDNQGFHDLNPNFDENTDKFSDLWKIADRYCGLKLIASFLLYRKKYNEAIEIYPFLKEVKEMTDKYIKEHAEADSYDIEHMQTAEKDLSEKLSLVKDNADLNKMAIDLDDKNADAYFNILEYYIFNNKKDDALDFYNQKYCKAFEKNKCHTFIEVVWETSDKIGLRGDFYRSLNLKKFAIDYENSQNKSEEVQCRNIPL